MAPGELGRFAECSAPGLCLELGDDGSVINYLRLARPKQWIKNLAVVAGPVFAMRAGVADIVHTFEVFAAFCLASSATYAVNDVFDRKADDLHPIKRHRPVASGAVPPAGALIWALLLIAGSLALTAGLLPPEATVIIVAYFVTNLAYSLSLKRRIILDVILISIGFVLRAAAGVAAIDAYISPWLIVCTFTLCMFLGFGKRRCEIGMFDSLAEASEHRITLARYTPELLAHLVSVTAGIAIITFLLYTLDRDPAYAPPFNKHHLLYTIPLVVYGVFRYAMLTQTGQHHGPMSIFLHDRALQATIILWALMAGAIMIERHWLGYVGLEHLILPAGPTASEVPS